MMLSMECAIKMRLLKCYWQPYGDNFQKQSRVIIMEITDFVAAWTINKCMITLFLIIMIELTKTANIIILI